MAGKTQEVLDAAAAVEERLTWIFDSGPMDRAEFDFVQRAIGELLGGELLNRVLGPLIGRSVQWFSRRSNIMPPEIALLMRLMLTVVVFRTSNPRIHQLNSQRVAQLYHAAQPLEGQREESSPAE